MAALFMSALAVSGCSTSIADLPGVGLPGDAPARPKEANGYLRSMTCRPSAKRRSSSRRSRPRSSRAAGRADRQAGDGGYAKSRRQMT